MLRKFQIVIQPLQPHFQAQSVQNDIFSVKRSMFYSAVVISRRTEVWIFLWHFQRMGDKIPPHSFGGMMR